MKNVFFYFCIVLLTLPLCADGLIMLRCDNGSEDGFVKTPESMNLSTLQSNLNATMDTVVLVHGFNTSYNSAKDSFTYARNILSQELGARNYIGFYWPSNTWLDFGTAVDHANKTGPYLMHVLNKVTQWSNTGARINIISHSLGARAVLSTLKTNDARYINWGKSCFFAAAVHNDVFFTSFSGTNMVSKYNYVYFSKNDDVLKYLYSLYYWLFERSWEQLPGAEKFKDLTLEEKLEYMKNLEENVERIELTEFDAALHEQILRAEKDAMGLIGSFLGNSKELRQVENIEVSNVVNGHSYWNNSQVLRMAAQKLK